METIEERYVDKSGWADGPWQKEADKVQWLDKATGFPCLIVRGPVGALCGYVGVPAEHPWYGVDYTRIDVDVHGELTYSNKCQEDGKICHTVGPGEGGDVWWLGFDCSHLGDANPKYVDTLPYNVWGEGTYRTMEYVRQEVLSLAQQAKSASKNNTE